MLKRETQTLHPTNLSLNLVGSWKRALFYDQVAKVWNDVDRVCVCACVHAWGTPLVKWRSKFRAVRK